MVFADYLEIHVGICDCFGKIHFGLTGRPIGGSLWGGDVASCVIFAQPIRHVLASN
jgi:hypothetical protein